MTWHRLALGSDRVCQKGQDLEPLNVKIECLNHTEIDDDRTKRKYGAFALQSQMLRAITISPLYFRNENIFQDLDISMVKKKVEGSRMKYIPTVTRCIHCDDFVAI